MTATKTTCHAERTGDGYWTCDRLGGCPDCRRLARELDDVTLLELWEMEREADR